MGRRDLRKTSWRAETECTSGARTKPCNCKAFRNCRDLRKSSREKEGPTCSQREDQHKPNTANIYSKRPTSSCCLCLDIFLNRHVFQVQAISCHTNTAILIVLENDQPYLLFSRCAARTTEPHLAVSTHNLQNIRHDQSDRASSNNSSNQKRNKGLLSKMLNQSTDTKLSTKGTKQSDNTKPKGPPN